MEINTIAHPEVFIITTAHPLYPQVLELRQRVLRTPLGLNLFDEDLRIEEEEIVFVYAKDERVSGCVMLKNVDAHTFKLRQMAVAPEMQAEGIGRKLLAATAEFASRNGRNRIVLHARATAVPFYIKDGYVVKGEQFEEVGIPHFYMEKQLS